AGHCCCTCTAPCRGPCPGDGAAGRRAHRAAAAARPGALGATAARLGTPHPHPMNKLRQHGAALLAAMMTVTLVATLAAASLWQQWRSVEIEQADRTRIQSAWILTGALDWARLILREDFNADRIDTLSEPWAVPLKEARLSTFLAADQSNNMDTGSDADTVFLSGDISDLQAKMNLNCLVQAGVV